MTENKDDLISREALKKDIAEIFEIEEKIDAKWAKGLKYSLKIIDNAPTVDLWEMRQEATENALKKAEVLYTRPQGEWKHWGSPFSDEQVANSIVCSVCGARFVEIQDEVFNYCPNCGADMRGDKE